MERAAYQRGSGGGLSMTEPGNRDTVPSASPGRFTTFQRPTLRDRIFRPRRPVPASSFRRLLPLARHFCRTIRVAVAAFTGGPPSGVRLSDLYGDLHLRAVAGAMLHMGNSRKN